MSVKRRKRTGSRQQCAEEAHYKILLNIYWKSCLAAGTFRQVSAGAKVREYLSREENTEPLCLCWLAFAVENLAWLRKSLICIRPV